MISITIDGPSGAGKSTVANRLAETLGYHHLNTGALYRAVTYACLQAGIKHSDEEKVQKFMHTCDIKVEFVDGEQKVYIRGDDYTPYLRINEVSVNTPLYSVNNAVRQGLTDYIRTLSNEINMVLDGRDIGSFVLPDATYKFYLDASVEERAKRRRAELLGNGEDVPLATIIAQLDERDRFDRMKKVAPLVIPKNAIIIDCSFLGIQEVVDEMLRHITNG